MVKLRSGYIYIDKKMYNHIVNSFNKLIENIEFKLINSNISNTYKNIKYMSNNLCLKNISNGEVYFKHNSEKFIISNHRLDYNTNFRKELFEILWIRMCKFIKKIKSINKISKINIKDTNDRKCLICFDILKKNDKINLCKNNGINHYYHNSCFMSLITTNNTKNLGEIKYECPYCRCKTINSKKIYIVK